MTSLKSASRSAISAPASTVRCRSSPHSTSDKLPVGDASSRPRSSTLSPSGWATPPTTPFTAAPPQHGPVSDTRPSSPTAPTNAATATQSCSPSKLKRSGLISAQSFAPYTREEITRRIEAADIPFGDVNEVAQFLDHPQLEGRDRWREIESPAGPLRAILPPMNLEGIDLQMGAIPEIGQHKDEVLREIGYDATGIADLRATKAV